MMYVHYSHPKTMTTKTTRGRTWRRWIDNNDNDGNNDDDKAEGGNCLNGTVIGRRPNQPCDRHPGRGPGILHVKASAGICTGIRLRTMRGWEGEGGEVGNTAGKGECLFNDDRNNDEYDDEYDDEYEYDNTEDGKGSCGGADVGGESDKDGRNVVHGLSFGGVGHRTSIVGPHAATAIIGNNDNNNCRRSGGASCPAPSGPSCPTGCCLLLSMLPTAVNGSGRRALGVWSYAWWRRRRLAPLYSILKF
jgi:hypothetical protein